MKLLHIDSSILGDNSASRQLSQSVVKAWQAAEPSSWRPMPSATLPPLSCTMQPSATKPN